MKTFSIVWEMHGELNIEAETEEEAEEKFYKLSEEEVLKSHDDYGVAFIEELDEIPDKEEFDDENLDQYWSEVEYDEY